MLCITSQEFKGLRRQHLILQHGIGGIIQTFVQPDGKDRNPQLPYPDTVIFVSDGVEQAVLKIHLHSFKKDHLVGIRDRPDIRSF